MPASRAEGRIISAVAPCRADRLAGLGAMAAQRAAAAAVDVAQPPFSKPHELYDDSHRNRCYADSDERILYYSVKVHL